MKRLTLALAALIVLAVSTAPAEAGHRRPYRGRYASAHRYHGNAYAYRSYGYGYPVYGYSPYGADQAFDYFSRYPTYRYDVYSYPSYGYGGYFGGRYGGGAFAGSPNDGNHWYWLSQQAGQGQIPWSSVNEQMYGRR